MLKHIYRAIILVVIFAGSLYYFSRDIKEVVFVNNNTTDMEGATFPLVTIKTGDETINMLHGYSSNMAANVIREAVTPLNTDQSFEVQFDKDGPEIKKLNYEVREFSGNRLLESDSVSVFETNGDKQTARVKLNAELASGKEYAVKITLISSKSEKIYYYMRVKVYQSAYLSDKLNFVMSFHNAIMNKDTGESIIQYLEPSQNADNTSLAYVNINSSFDLICWGKLSPTVITDIVPTVREIYQETASIELNYYVEAKVAGVKEKYRVTEFYRVRYSPDRMYLLNYERHMEALFDTSLASVSKSEFKLGITDNQEIPYKAGIDSSKLAFVRDGELFFYDLLQNDMTKVFSFRNKTKDYLRDYYDQHDIRILSLDAEGNMDFLVYGYMNRGQYEGRVGVILYRFIRAENRIEELVYIPVDEPYQSLKENLGELSYLSSSNIFYLQIYNTVYSYNLTTRNLSEIASGIEKSQVILLPDADCAVWQESSDIKSSENICIMNLETGDKNIISAKTGYNIKLLGKIDSNIIYGYVKSKDIAVQADGSLIVPLSSVEIASIDKQVLKSYKKKGYYITDISVNNNVIELKRVRKDSSQGWVKASEDDILNMEKTVTPYIGISSRTTKQALKEYYITLPEGFEMKSVPKEATTVNTVISQDPTVRLTNTALKQLYYYPYITGGIAGAYEDAAEAIGIARDGIGVVCDSNHQLVWERGVRQSSCTISGFKDITATVSSGNSVTRCLIAVLKYQGVPESKINIKSGKKQAYDILKKYSIYTPVRLTGITLDDALYYVTEGRPVIAMTNSQHAVVIYGYDTFNITVYDPINGSSVKMGIKDSTKLFENAGNVFISYLSE